MERGSHLLVSIHQTHPDGCVAHPAYREEIFATATLTLTGFISVYFLYQILILF